MDVRGFGVALIHGIQIEIKPGLEILLPNPACMTVMKTLAWKDRGMATRGRDALDLVELLLRAEDIFGLEVLYDDHLGIVEAKGGDLQLAAAQVLGAEARMAVGAVMAQEVASILVKGMAENLVTQLLEGSGGMPTTERNESITNILESFLNGLQGPTPPPLRRLGQE
ncbi:hypothetical protein [Geothrix sp. 21YS21S-2]|uniref:hypothetical protein n=1 Tax=Geothrix sp. 21YS21S-2 TaxID=3068893 RepID=UPI0027B9583D|nr:hypothetical protein [Geothrix sp. 21YS21S-2]